MSEFEDFLTYFPLIELPVNISSEYFSVFSSFTKPVPEILISKYIMDESRIVAEENDPETEYIACFRINENQNFNAIVYLRISLLNYEYHLHTYDNAGRTISSEVISSLNYDGTFIKETAALIDETLRIWKMEGTSAENSDFDPANTRFESFLINDNGEIIKKTETQV